VNALVRRMLWQAHRSAILEPVQATWGGLNTQRTGGETMINRSVWRRRGWLTLGVFGLLGLSIAAGTLAANRVTGPPYKGPEGGLPAKYPAFTVVKGAKVTIGYEVVADNEANIAAVKYAKLEAKRLGANLIVLYDHVKLDQQVTNFGQLLAQKVDGIIVFLLDPKTLQPQLVQAQKAGIPVFSVDATLSGQPLNPLIKSEILTGRDHQAYAQVKYMASVKPHAKIAVIGLGFPVPGIEYYVKRVDYWAPKFGLTVLGHGDNPSDDVSGGERTATGLLGRFPSLDGVVAYNDPTAIGAVAAARASGRKLVAIGLNGGSDGRTSVQHGRLAATVQVPWNRFPAILMDAIYSLKTHQVASVPKVLLAQAVLVTPQNIGRVPSWDQDLENLRAKVK
jgi:ribose transport system substrate-binding protein